MTDPNYRERVTGMLVGHLCGEALGAGLEFCPPVKRRSQTEITGGGLLGWRPGEGTDDSDLMLAVLRSIDPSHGFILCDLRRRMIDWLHDGPRDVGTTTETAIRAMIGRDIVFGGIATNSESAQGNGSLSRCAPMALLRANEYQLDRILEDQTNLTHGHRMCSLADRVYVRALRLALQGSDRETVLNALLAECRALESIRHKIIDRSLLSWEELPSSGWVIDSLGVVAWALRNAENFEEGVIDIVCRGADADTNGAIAGAMLGAIFGVKGIPQRWIHPLEQMNGLEVELMRLGYSQTPS